MFSSPAAVFGSLVFGAIGLAAFIYGKRMTVREWFCGSPWLLASF
jgi:hypothetical protein